MLQKKKNVADEYLSNGHYAYESAQRKQTSANIREIMTEREKRANDMCSLSFIVNRSHNIQLWRV